MGVRREIALDESHPMKSDIGLFLNSDGIDISCSQPMGPHILQLTNYSCVLRTRPHFLCEKPMYPWSALLSTIPC